MNDRQKRHVEGVLLQYVRVAADTARYAYQGVREKVPGGHSHQKPNDEGDITLRRLNAERLGKNKPQNRRCGKGIDHRPQKPHVRASVPAAEMLPRQTENNAYP